MIRLVAAILRSATCQVLTSSNNSRVGVTGAAHVFKAMC